MSIEQLQREMEHASDAERLELAMYLRHLRRRNDPEHAAELSRRMKEMDEGKRVTLEEVQRRHEALKTQGR